MLIKRRRKTFGKSSEGLKRFFRAIEKLYLGLVLVEGKRDVLALKKALGIRAIAIAFRPKQMVELVQESKAEEVIILTDLDRRGNALARMLEKELTPFVVCDTKTREVLASTLRIKHFEEFAYAYSRFIEEHKEEVLVWQKLMSIP